MPRASAYLSVFDDWDLLELAIASIAPHVDEIVVVDGAYRWMAPFLESTGRDPAHSDPRVREALAPFASKLCWINQLWDNELHKRATGYAACSHRYVYRVDSDEVLFLNAAALDRYFASGKAVAEMEMPIVVAPGLIRGRRGHPIERQGLLFDRHQVSAAEHLAYLWLVLTPGEQEQVGHLDPTRRFVDPVAFNAHLTHWRPPASAVARARFYVLNYLRGGAATQLAPGFTYSEAGGFGAFLHAVPAGVFTECLMGHAIVAGSPELDGCELVCIPLTPDQEAVYAPYYGRFLDSLASSNLQLARQARAVAQGEFIHIDLTTKAAVAPFWHEGSLQLVFSSTVAAARVDLLTLHPADPWQTATPLPHSIQGGALTFALPEAGATIRRTLRVAVWTQAGDALLRVASPQLGHSAALQGGLIQTA